MNLRLIPRLARRATLLCAFVLLTPTAQAQGTGKMLVSINPQEYTHPINLWRYYHNYWFYQGPLLEPIVIQTLNEKFGEVSLCSGNSSANTLVKINPSVFYNPKMTQYYGKLTAHVYTGSGKLIASYKAEAETSGFLEVFPDHQIATTYRLAMDKLIAKMQTDTALQQVMKDGLAVGETSLPCSMVVTLPEEVVK
ncbi:MAG: hypothetical protein HOP04_01065 [Methylophilaceae bacterium]|nr:hypothetical protein [Methylophilaceae bacterium]